MIKTMKAHEGQQLKTDFLLSDDVYAKAHIQATDNVYLWLGVRVNFYQYNFYLLKFIIINIIYNLFINKKIFILQANVMLEYNLCDATELISRNIQLATDNMRQVDDDLDFLRYS